MVECPQRFLHLPVSKCNFLRTLKIQTNRKKSLTANAAKQIQSKQEKRKLVSPWRTIPKQVTNIQHQLLTNQKVGNISLF